MSQLFAVLQKNICSKTLIQDLDIKSVVLQRGDKMASPVTIGSLASAAKIPGPHDKVHKDECFFSFDSPTSENGLYVCLNSFLGFGRKYVEMYAAKTGRHLFLHMRRVKRPLENADGDNGEEPGIPEKVSRLAIGVEGGFKADVKKFEYEDFNEIVVIPGFAKYGIDDQNVPLAVQMSAKAVLSADSATKKAEVESASATWDGEQISVSKHAENLEQLDNGVKIPPRGWVCSYCDLTTNLWLNMTDGSVLCGRKFFDGSGGNNHAVEHYAKTKYPLAVKLGTITPDGKGDVFSYPEDTMVEDPWLSKHLAHFGIKVTEMAKTDKSMVELEIDMNKKFGEWATLCESEAKLEAVHGPGYTGMENLGNTCYLNSVMQVLFSIPDFVREYVDSSQGYFNSLNLNNNTDPANDFHLQMVKLGNALWNGDYSHAEDGIRPNMFKNIIGRGHVEFAGKGQQDAQEFYLHLLNVMERENKRNGRTDNSVRCLQFEVEDRVECGATGKVHYLSRVEDYLPISIPLEDCVNQARVDEWKAKCVEAEARGEKMDNSRSMVRPLIPFNSCLDVFLGTETVADFYSPAAKAKTFAKKKMRLKTFPDFLLIQLKKFAVDDQWVPYKLDVEVDMPETIDLASLKATGLQPGEELMPEDEKTEEAKAPFVPDAKVLDQLVDMGFSRNCCTRALFETKNSGVEAAMNWVMEHMGDANVNDPFVDPNASKGKKPSIVVDEGNLATLMDMSFTREQSVAALKNTDNNVERAVDWIFSHPDGVPAEEGGQGGDEASASNTTNNLTNGSPKYKLMAFISHMGTSHMVGHYVCHILREGRWVIFNDAKVALSQNPPKNLGYLYLYQRI